MRDGTATGITHIVSQWLKENGFEIKKKIRGQGYDGASVMSGKKGGVQKFICDEVHKSGSHVPVPFVHCSAHNLNLVINDAAEATVPGIMFFGTLRTIFSFFGSSLNRWAELALTDETCKQLKLKKLCTTRWSSRVDAVRAVKNRYTDILKVFTRISLESKDQKEKN